MGQTPGAVTHTPVLFCTAYEGTTTQSIVAAGTKVAVTGITFSCTGATGTDFFLVGDGSGSANFFSWVPTTAGSFYLDLKHPFVSDGLNVVVNTASSMRYNIRYRVL